MNTFGGVDVFIISALHGGELLHTSAALPRGKHPFDRRSMDDVETGKLMTLQEFELGLLCRPVCSQSLY
jgi:hypothetical protein